VYGDIDGVLTSLLIDRGYLASPTWDRERPMYYIEAKATTSFLSTAFFVSHNQEQMMEGMALPEEGASGKVYLIARVFNLGLEGMGLKLYLDPAKHRSEGNLIFRSDKYEVTPAWRF
jgi:hypothetical protein